MPLKISVGVAAWAAVIVGCVMSDSAVAQRSEHLLPNTTKAYLSLPDIPSLQAKWKETDLGKLARHPQMKPFIEDFRRQLQSRFSNTSRRLGIAIGDLDGVYGGEVSVGWIQPDFDTTQHAVALVADVTGHTEAAAALIEKVWQRQQARGAKRRTERMEGVEATVITFPAPRQTADPFDVFYAVHRNRLVAVDHAGEFAAILRRLNGAQDATLADVPAFQSAMAYGKYENHEGDIRWFLEPFGYTEISRATNPPIGKKRTDLLEVLSHQGFRRAITGLGGHIHLMQRGCDILHRTFIHSPPARDNAPRYELAARMLDFPNRDDLGPAPFIPSSVGTYLSVSWRMKQAFDYSKSLVNELVGAEKGQDLFEEALQSLATDPSGPRVDMRKDLIAYLDDRATVIANPHLPVTPKSERLLVLIRVTNEPAVRKAIDRLMENEEGATARMIEGIRVWEIVPEPPPVDVPDLEFQGFTPFAPEETEQADEKKKIAVPENSAVTVTDGYLILANHVDYLAAFLKTRKAAKPLAQAADYRAIAEKLRELGAGKDAFRLFTRTDQSYRITYELLRQGKMPEAETLLGKLLNRLLTDEDAEGPRKQEIDGSKMPPFETVAEFFGPAGLYVRTVENGWEATGCLLARASRPRQATAVDAEAEAQRAGASRRR